jgi:uncharacterized membrane protein YfcA
MLMILEIALTVSAWKRGWRGRALLPLAIGLFIAFFAGVLMGASGAGDESLGFLIIVDIAVVVSLIVMVAKPRRTQDKVYRPGEGTTIANNGDKTTATGDYSMRNIAAPPKL